MPQNRVSSPARGIARSIEASERGLPKLAKKMEITALSQEDRKRFKEAAQPAVIELIEGKFGDKGAELLGLFLEEVAKAGETQYMQ